MLILFGVLYCCRRLLEAGFFSPSIARVSMHLRFLNKLNFQMNTEIIIRLSKDTQNADPTGYQLNSTVVQRSTQV
jgi:hypothetical protein